MGWIAAARNILHVVTQLDLIERIEDDINFLCSNPQIVNALMVVL